MKYLNRILLAFTAICPVLLMSSCSDFPEDLSVNGDVTIEYGEPKLQGNTYSLEVTINVDLENASESITSAKILGEFFNDNNEIDILGQLNKKSGGKAKVVFENQSVGWSNDRYLKIETEHFMITKKIEVKRDKGDFCKTSGFSITSPSTANQGAIVTFNVVENPFVSSNIDIKTINLSTQKTSHRNISSYSTVGPYQYILNNEELNQNYKCALFIDNIQISDWVEYRTPGPLTTIYEDSYNNSYITFTIPNATLYSGSKRVELWLRSNTSSSWSQADKKDNITGESVTLGHGWNFIGYYSVFYQARFYINNNLCAIKEGTVTRY